MNYVTTHKIKRNSNHIKNRWRDYLQPRYQETISRNKLTDLNDILTYSDNYCDIFYIKAPFLKSQLKYLHLSDIFIYEL